MNGNWEIWLGVATLFIGVVTFLQTIALFYVGAKANRIEGLEKAVTSKAEAVVETKFELLATEFRGLVVNLSTIVQGVQDRLEKGDVKFEIQNQGHQQLQLTSLAKENSMKEWVREHFGSREELAAVAQALQETRIKLATFEEHLKRVEANE